MARAASTTPQLKRCGLIEAARVMSLLRSPSLTPQLKRCGLIEAVLSRSDCDALGQTPQLKRCGLIEAVDPLRADCPGQLDSAAETLRPH